MARALPAAVRRATMAALSALGLLAGGTAWADCSRADVDAATTPEAARAVAAGCAGQQAIRFAALDKLNEMPLPSAVPAFRPLALRTGQPEKITFSADIFFNVDEAYPVPAALNRLADLVERMSDRGTLYVIVISSSENAFERREPFDVADMRTAIVRRYLIAAGIEAARIYGKVHKPEHDETLDGLARDRCAQIEVVMYRDKVGN